MFMYLWKEAIHRNMHADQEGLTYKAYFRREWSFAVNDTICAEMSLVTIIGTSRVTFDSINFSIKSVNANEIPPN